MFGELIQLGLSSTEAEVFKLLLKKLYDNIHFQTTSEINDFTLEQLIYKLYHHGK